MFQKQPDQIFLLKAGAAGKSQRFQEPVHPVLQGIFMDKQRGSSLGYTPVVVVVPLRCFHQHLLLTAGKGGIQLLIKTVDELRFSDRGMIKYVMASGVQLPDVVERLRGGQVQNHKLLVRAVDIP